jgi:hypothetical protein
MLAEDEHAFFQALARLGAFEVFPKLSKEEPRPLEMPLPPLPSRSGGHAHYLCIHRKDLDQKLIVKFNDVTSMYVIDQIYSEVIEFTRSSYVDADSIRGESLLAKGRLWFDVAGKCGTQKSTEFTQWASSALRILRSQLVPVREQVYAGAAAIRMQREGQLRFAMK